MSVQLIFKIAAVGILVSVLCQVLKHSGREEQAFLTSLAGLLLVLFGFFPIFRNCFIPLSSYFPYKRWRRGIRVECSTDWTCGCGGRAACDSV